MEKVRLKGHGGSKGVAEGEAIVIKNRICFIFDIDIMSGTYQDPSSEMKGQSVTGKILVLPSTRGSTGGPYGLYLLCKADTGPKAIIAAEKDPTMVASAVLSEIPLVYALDQNPLDAIATGDRVSVDGEKGIVEITKAV